MSGGFKRSSRFGIIGLFVVMAAVAVVALTMGSGQANPKPVYALIFGIVGAYLVVLFALQRADLNRAEGVSRRGTELAATEGREIDDPTKMSEPDLWAALAVGPIDPDAVKARAELWAPARSSLGLGVVITILIFLTVPPIYLLESFVPLLIGGPLIAIAAIYGSVRAVGAGGQIDQGYANVGRAMAPLGLAVAERPNVSIEMRDPVTPRMGPRVHGDLVLSGERHGRPVSVRLGGGTSEVTVGAAVEEFEAKSRDGKVRPAKGTPEQIAEALRSVPSSTRWKRVRATGGSDGVLVSRRGDGQADWLLDLWLAERLAST